MGFRVRDLAQQTTPFDQVPDRRRWTGRASVGDLAQHSILFGKVSDRRRQRSETLIQQIALRRLT